MGLLRALVSTALPFLHFTSLLNAAELTGAAKEHRVSLRVVFRAFCPACQWLVGDPLLELVRTEEFRDIIDLTLIPAAGMRENQGEISCEAGPLECTGHRWQVCVLDKDRLDVVKYLGTIACFEGHESGQVGDWSTKAQNCLTDEERDVVKECVDNRSKDLLLKMIREEQSGSVPWMPYITANQEVLGSLTEGVPLSMLKRGICSAYTGPKSFYPAECLKLSGEQKVVSPEESVQRNDDKPLVATDKKLEPTATPSENTVILEAQAPTDANAPEVVNSDNDVKMKEQLSTPASPVTTTVVVAAGKVQLEMYWRAFCPGCMSFITKSLLTLVKNKEFQEIIDFHPVPAAGTSINAKGNFVCTSGMVECLGHKWLSCAVEEFEQISELVEHIACMESRDNKGMTWSSIIKRCYEGEAYTKMKSCYDTKSDDLLRKNVAKRQALPLPWVPYVLINGTPLGESSHGIGFKQLLNAVCNAYSGPKDSLPAECQPKRLRDEMEVQTPDDKEVIKPCAPATKDTGKTGAEYDDPPGIGKPISIAPEAKTVTEFNAKVIGGNHPDDKDRTNSTFIAVVLPGICFVGLVIVALRLTRDHKKDA
ncbi:Gamma-interferon inducible lysosomal thiol reductase [Plasmopara halstedii]|uniref:Gamma-interferon inducible lysosomal thiol reductase n=1 Tax=Plasmopara halstedii TaxID=4781 RepID=A0A0P1B5Y1_PLAHL|nr:Gamma-interferon inducible lysosomal thiol reductase [Plasmopara halstedii]CEG49241.1 Gamma-interferon inducible lysosomal thiol reductase [Plasmopara halstedii]|eukprot:XP_024585610.1 Gamma-interferon inducible lysosomal thiol reductase [Plasmopara halstedii]